MLSGGDDLIYYLLMSGGSIVLVSAMVKRQISDIGQYISALIVHMQSSRQKNSTGLLVSSVRVRQIRLSLIVSLHRAHVHVNAQNVFMYSESKVNARGTRRKHWLLHQLSTLPCRACVRSI